MSSATENDFGGPGYLGTIHRDVGLAHKKELLPLYIATVKHAFLFTPRIVLADHMLLTPNFTRAYEHDQGFRDLIHAGLIDIAHFEKYANGRPFTLVEHRKFLDFLKGGRPLHLDPRDPRCPEMPFDAELSAIDASAGQIQLDGVWRDPLFTEFAGQELDNETLKPLFGGLYTAYTTAFRRMRDDLAAKGYPLGVIHFDAGRKLDETDNIFDYMARISSLKNISREQLVHEFGEEVARAHRVLAMKAEMTLLQKIYAILPTELRDYKALALDNPAEGSLDEREAELTAFDVDLAAVNSEVVAALSLSEVLELRRAAADFFALIGQEANDMGSIEVFARTLKEYLTRLNDTLAYKALAPQRTEKFNSVVKIARGKVAHHRNKTVAGIALTFKILSGLGHSFFSHHTPFPDSGGIIDPPLKQAEDLATAQVLASSSELLIKKIPAHFLVSSGSGRILQYEE